MYLRTALLLFCLLPFTTSSPLLVAKVEEKDERAFARAVDVSVLQSTSTYSCFRSNGYVTAFVRVYYAAGSGSVDTNGPTNIRNANSANVGTEAYMTPNPSSGKPGYTQVDEAYNYLTNAGINLRSIWIQVTSPIGWPSSQTSNSNFIYNMMQRAQQRNLRVGIYTNSYDWQQITGSWTGWQTIPGVQLWYWHVNGPGTSGMTSQDFSDFAPFAGFNSPSVKQYGQSVSVCGFSVNTDVYLTGKNGKTHEEETAGVITVGQI